MLRSPKRCGPEQVSRLKSLPEMVIKEPSHTMRCRMRGNAQPLGRGCSALSLRVRETQGRQHPHLHMSNSMPTQALWPQKVKGREDMSTRAGGPEEQVPAGRQLPRWSEMKALITFLVGYDLGSPHTSNYLLWQSD